MNYECRNLSQLLGLRCPSPRPQGRGRTLSHVETTRPASDSPQSGWPDSLSLARVFHTWLKDTKNTVKFEEVQVHGEAPIIGSLYVQKWFIGDATHLKVTVEVG